MDRDDRQSHGAEAEKEIEKIWQISAEGVAPEILDLASAWLNAAKGDQAAALVLISERLLMWRSISSTGMTRGALSVYPELDDSKVENE